MCRSMNNSNGDYGSFVRNPNLITNIVPATDMILVDGVYIEDEQQLTKNFTTHHTNDAFDYGIKFHKAFFDEAVDIDKDMLTSEAVKQMIYRFKTKI